uniref:Uncharacterized protein n=1 Tax=viral metagenome TaxID=1070528 RepID=A0A6C0F0U8_9ZZZZ
MNNQNPLGFLDLNSSSYDISDFVKSGDEILICSDFEGVLPKKQLENFISIFDKVKGDFVDKVEGDFKAKKIIYLGDIFDNTACVFSNNNYCALKTLKYLVDNPERSRYVVGNRDINKIKLVPLLQLQKGRKWWINRTEESGPELSYDLNTNYIEIISNLLIQNFGLSNPNDLQFVKKIWNVKTMSNYKPFWSSKLKAEIDKWFYNGENIQPMHTLHDRFNRIFGLDTNTGTMSADNTLTGIPNELFGDSITKIINDIKKKIQEEILKGLDKAIELEISNRYEETLKNNENIKIKHKDAKEKDKLIKTEIESEKNRVLDLIEDVNQKKKLKQLILLTDEEIRSAIVFTVFMRMLDEDLYKLYEAKRQIDRPFSVHNLGDIEGYLWKYLTSAPTALYAKKGNDLLLFSHGGITNEFVQINNKNIGFKILSEIIWNAVLSNNNNQVRTSPKLTEAEQHGNKKDIIGNIDSYNETYFKIVKECFEKFKKTKITSGNNNMYVEEEINSDLMILLSISAPAENNPVIYESGYETSNFSPIQPRLPDDSVLTSEDNNTQKIFNFCGHASSGNGYGLKKIRENMFFINTDLVATLFKAAICDKTTYDSNYLWLTIKYNGNDTNDFNIHIKGVNTLNTGKFIVKIDSVTTNNTVDTILSKQDKKYTVVLIDGKYVDIDKTTTPSIKLELDYEGKLNNSFFKNKDKYRGRENIVYNGEVTYDGKKYDLYSYLKIVAPNTKNILMLDSLEFSPGEEHFGGYHKRASNKKSIKKNRKNKTKGKLIKKNSTRNYKLKSKKH